MRTAFKNIFIIVFLLLSYLNSYTQANYKTILDDKLCKLNKVVKHSNDTILASISFGKKLGVEIGATGKVISPFNAKGRDAIELGFGSVYSVEDSSAVIIINPINADDTTAIMQIREGDYVELNLRIPYKPYRSIFSLLGFLDIGFTNLNKLPVYGMYDIVYNDGKALEDSLLNIFAKEMQGLYETVKDRQDSSLIKFKVPLTTGRYKGYSVYDVMRDCNGGQISSYLKYVKDYPRSYRCNVWELGYYFLDWVYSGGTMGRSEMGDSIIAYKNKPDFLKRFIDKHRDDLVADRCILMWYNEASVANTNEEPEGVKRLQEIMRLTTLYLNDDNSTGIYNYSKAEINESNGNYSLAIPFYNRASSYFFTAKNYLKYLDCLSGKGYNYRRLEQYDNSLKAYDSMFTIIEKQDLGLTKEQRLNTLSAGYNDMGWAYNKKGDYTKAIETYFKAIEQYKLKNSFSAYNYVVKLQLEIANLYKKLGENTKALLIYNEQLASYKKLSDRKNAADVLDNIAYLQSQSGNYREAMLNYQTALYSHLFFKDINSAGYSQSSIAQCYWSLGKYDSAINSHNIALNYRREANSDDGQAYSWKKLGGLYNVAGEKAKALAAYDSAAYYYTAAKDSNSLKELLTDVGDVYKNDLQYQKAFSYYYRVHTINLKKANKADLVSSFYTLGSASYYYDADTSKKYFTLCNTLAKEIGDKSNQLYASLNLGVLYYKEYNYDTGEKFFNSALNAAVSDKNKLQEANCYKFIGNANAGKLSFDKAIEYFKKSVFIYDSLGDKSSLPDIYKNIGNTYATKGDFAEARRQFQNSINVARAINSRADIGYAYNAISFLYVIQGELSKAQASTDSAYAIFKDLNNNWQMAETYFNMGVVAEAKANGIDAIKYYLKADSLYVVEKEIFSRSACQTNMGCVFYYQADFDNALKYFFEAERILSKINTISESHMLAPSNIGAAYYYKKDYVKAEKYLLEGYKKSTDKKVKRMINIAAEFLGMTYYQTKRYAEAEKYLLESYALSNEMNESDLVIQGGMFLGRLYIAQNNAAKGIDYLSKTVQYAKKIENSKYTWEILYEYGLSFYNQKQYDSAIAYFKQSVEIVENASKNLFGGAEAKKLYSADYRKVDLYNKLVASLATSGNKSDALYYADRSNNQAVKDQMDKAGLQTEDKEKAKAIKTGSELLQKKTAVEQAIIKEKSKPEKEQNKELIASLESVKSVTESDYTNFTEELVKKYPDLQSYFANTNPKDFKNYIEDIPDSTIVVLYVINDPQLFIFTVTNKETAIKIVDLKQDINQQAARFLSVLRNPNNATGTGTVTLRSSLKPIDDVRGDFKSEATSLYDLLITPIADQMKDKKNICFIPNGKLSSIPFQCLGYADDKKNFHFLVENYAIFYTSKIDIFRKNFKQRAMQSSLAVFGNPDKSLPGATTEANEIAKIIPTATVYIEEKATEDKAKESLQKYNYIHFATHGVLDYTNFEDSYLLFAKDADSDGKLTIKEINGLTKQTNSMVVLSACETAVNKEAVKGWYISPANAFLTNRVDAVLGSLWKVPDETTNLLLQEFYNNIEKKGMTKVEALRHAQAAVSTNSKYTHPFYWSAFVLYGEWR